MKFAEFLKWNNGVSNVLISAITVYLFTFASITLLHHVAALNPVQDFTKIRFLGIKDSSCAFIHSYPVQRVPVQALCSPR